MRDHMRVHFDSAMLLRIFMLGLLAANFALASVRFEQPYLNIVDYLNMDVPRPYRYRLLLVPVAGFLHACLGHFDRAVSGLPAFMASKESLTYFSMIFISMLLALELMWRLSVLVAGKGFGVVGVAVLFLVLYFMFPANINLNFMLPYDIPSVAFHLAMLYCLVKHGRVGFFGLVLFVLATLNRETSLIFLFFLFLRERTAGVPVWKSMVLPLAGVWLLIKIALLYRMAGTPSEEIINLPYNFRTLAKPWQWPAILPLMFVFFASLLVFLKIDRGSAWMGASVAGFLCIFMVANITEMRAFGDIVPYFTVGLLVVLKTCWRAEHDVRRSSGNE